MLKKLIYKYLSYNMYLCLYTFNFFYTFNPTFLLQINNNLCHELFKYTFILIISLSNLLFYCWWFLVINMDQIIVIVQLYLSLFMVFLDAFLMFYVISYYYYIKLRHLFLIFYQRFFMPTMIKRLFITYSLNCFEDINYIIINLLLIMNLN